MALSVVLFFIFTLGMFGFSSSKFDNAFMEVRNKPTFVDKTPFIYEFLQHKYLFINAPSKFGKSTNLDMLSLFLSNHRSKQTIEDNFIWTKIWENKEFVKNNLGQYPVIHFSLKVRGYSSDYEHTLTTIKVSLYNAFVEHIYLLESEKLSEQKIKALEIYTDLIKIKMMYEDKVSHALSFLAELLYEHHGKPVILLADEFGRGITEGIIKSHSDLSSIVKFYSSILNCTFYNESIISHALLSGETWLYGLEGHAVSLLERVPFMHKVEIGRFYGFTYEEVDSLMNKFNISMSQRSDALKWYGGYYTFDGLFKVYNPYSVAQYISHNNTMVFWTGSDLASDVISNMVEVDSLKKQIVNLVMRKNVDLNLEKDTKIVDAEFLSHRVKEMPQNCENFFLQILVETGYLTFAEHQGQSSNIALTIPNEEVHSAIIKYSV